MKKFLLFCGTVTGFVLIPIVGGLVREHAHIIAEVRDISIPLIAEIPRLEQRASLLSEQVELAELQAALRVGSPEERVHVYVLPEEFDIDRIIALFDFLYIVLPKREFIVSMSPIELHEKVSVGNGLEALPITVSFSIQEQGIASILDFFKLAGTVTVADALTHEELNSFLISIEEENPAGVVSLEQFLFTDLLTYAREPRSFEDRLRRSFTSVRVQRAFDELLRTSLLKSARTYLGSDIGAALEQQHLWPMPFLTFQEISLDPSHTSGWYTLSLTIRAYRRTQQDADIF